MKSLGLRQVGSRPQPRPAGLHADDVEALSLLRVRGVLRGEGPKEGSLGPPPSAQARLG